MQFHDNHLVVAPVRTIDSNPTVSEPSLVARFFARAEKIAVDQKKTVPLAAEIYQKQEHIIYLQNLLAEFLTLTKPGETLDLSSHPELLEKIKIAQEKLGVALPGVTLYTENEEKIFTNNINLATDNLEKESSRLKIELEKREKDLQKHMTALISVSKTLHQIITNIARGIRG